MTTENHSFSRGARRSLLVYNFLFPFVFAALLPGFLVRMLRRGSFKKKFGQRLGRFDDSIIQRFEHGSWIWIHSISVGETGTALKLARALHAKEPGVQVALSVTTSTGYAVAEQNAEPWIEVIYNPIDLRHIVRRVLDLIRPRQLVLIETEVWPNLLAECRRRQLPVALVDARLSPRSEARFLRFRSWTAPLFRLLDLICVPYSSDVARWQKLDVDPHRLRHTGSIKFDEPSFEPNSRSDELRALLRQIGAGPDTPILLGGSTWPPEESTLAHIAREAGRDRPGLLLILVPRHVERSGRIVRELTPLDFRIVRRSELAANSNTAVDAAPGALACDILLIDTTGELRQWYEVATVVFVGKSIVATGGQNPAEPAALAKAVVVGPHMENFAALVAELRSNDAIIQVKDIPQLASEIRALLADQERRNAVGVRARETLQTHQGAIDRVASLLLSPIRPSPS